MPENRRSSISPDAQLDPIALPPGATAIQSTRPEPGLAAVKDEVQRAEKQPIAAPSPVVPVRARLRRFSGHATR